MPSLPDTIHLDMLHASRRREEPRKLGIYGLQWGDPEVSGPLKFIRDRYILPYIDFDHTAVDRWLPITITGSEPASNEPSKAQSTQRSGSPAGLNCAPRPSMGTACGTVMTLSYPTVMFLTESY
jgi:hypothetical protein